MDRTDINAIAIQKDQSAVNHQIKRRVDISGILEKKESDHEENDMYVCIVGVVNRLICQLAVSKSAANVAGPNEIFSSLAGWSG